jgi:hemerythrin-like domain-containing protein
MLNIQTQPRTQQTDNSFRNPLGLMSDCHRRIEMFFARLIEVAETDRGHQLTDSRRETLETALRYFSAGAPLHTEDEEVSLFPRLRAVGGPFAEAALKALEELESDHRAAEAAHNEIDSLGMRWLEEGTLPQWDADRLVNLAKDLRELYRGHIDIEDNHVFPLAKEALGADVIEQVGREMASRRGLDYDNIPLANRCAQRRLRRELAPGDNIAAGAGS